MSRRNILVALPAALSWALEASAQGFGPTPVAVCPVVERDVPATVRLVGTVRADRSAVIASEVSGSVLEYEVRAGDFLRRGDVICRIDPTVAKLRYDEAAGRLEALRQKLMELENGARPEELRRLRAAVEQAQALLDKWKFEKQRVSRLYEIGQSNDKERHDVEMEYLAAERWLAHEKAALELAENGARAEVIAQARADVMAQTATVARLERDWKKTDIRAPFDGFVVARRTEVGEWLTEGGAAAEMVAVETVKVRVDVPERAVPFARPGQPVSVEVEALGASFQSVVARVIPQAESAVPTFPIEIDLSNAEHRLLPGMFAWVRVPSGPSGPRLMVHQDAIVARGPGKQIFVVREGRDGTPTAMPVDVTTGLELDELVEVSAPGLRAGDLVVCRANERLYGPTPVIPTPMSTTRPSSGPSAGQAADR